MSKSVEVIENEPELPESFKMRIPTRKIIGVGILDFVHSLVVKALLLYGVTHVAPPLLQYHSRIASEQSLRKS